MKRTVAGLLLLVCVAPGGDLARGDASVPAYDAFGFAGYADGRLFSLARRGLRHNDDPSGHIALFTDPGPPSTNEPSPWVAAADSAGADDRNVAGGISPSGRVIFFYTRYTKEAGLVATPEAVVAVRAQLPWQGAERAESIAVSCCDPIFSAYGPMLALPSGRLMQTFYARDTTGASRVFAKFSDDDGRNWAAETEIDRSGVYAPSETAAALAGGSSDETAVLVAVSRAQVRMQDVTRHALAQYVSSDGGRTWTHAGFVAVSTSSDAVIPWLAPLSHGRLALVWADRGTLTIKVSIAAAGDVAHDPNAWPEPQVLYTSYLDVARPANRAHFGYPSVASKGPSDSDKTVVFYDAPLYGRIPANVWSTALDPIDRRNMPVETNIMAVQLTAAGSPPTTLDTTVAT